MIKIRSIPSRLRQLYRAATSKRYVEYGGVILPPPHLRLCSAKLKADEYFLKSSDLEAERMVVRLGCRTGSRVLEIGCGSGRLPIGLARCVPEVDYLGLDILKGHIDWCTRYLTRAHPNFRFRFLNAYSERYNPKGSAIDETFRLPVPDDHYDIVYMYGVITNMADDHMRLYLREIRRVVKQRGQVFISGFVEEDVPSISVNPEGYLGLTPQGPLFAVRYERNYFLSVLAEAGLIVNAVERMGAEYFDSLTAFYLSK